MITIDWMNTLLPDLFASQRESDGKTVTIVSLAHTASPEDAGPGMTTVRIFADRLTIPAEGVTMHGMSSVIRARVLGAKPPGGAEAFPPSPYDISGPPWPLQQPISPPVNQTPGGTGLHGNPGHPGNSAGSISWSGFETETPYIIKACGGQGQQGQDGQKGGTGARGEAGPAGHQEGSDNPFDHAPPVHCVQGGPGGRGYRGGAGGAAGRAGDGGPGGSVRILYTGPTDPDNIIVSVDGGLPGDKPPQRVANPGEGGEPGPGGSGAACLKLNDSTHRCEPDGTYFPDGPKGDRGYKGAAASPANPGSAGETFISNGGSLRQLHLDDPHVFVLHQLSLHEAIRLHATGDAETARAITVWLRLATPSAVHPNGKTFGRHWPALHTRLAVLARRIDRGLDPFLIPPSAPRWMQAESDRIDDLFTRLLAVGVPLEQAFIAFSRKAAGLPSQAQTAHAFAEQAATIAEIYRDVAALHQAAVATVTHALPESDNTVLAEISAHAADQSDDIATTRAVLEQRFSLARLSAAAIETLDCADEQAWFEACGSELASMADLFAGGHPSEQSIPYRMFLFAMCQDLRQACLRYAAFRGLLTGKPLTVYPHDITELALRHDAAERAAARGG